MNETPLSRRYAEAFADVVERDGQLERARCELDAVADSLARSRPFQHLVRTSEQSRRQKRQMLRRLADRLGLLPQTARLLDYLARKRRTALLPQVARSFSQEADRRLGIQGATVTSALPLNPEQRRAIAARLEETCGARIRLEERVDESLIGGLQVRLDGRFYDASVRGELEKLREAIAHG
jgi:F-type H+-transporting ATPase subunit delta